MDKKKVGEFLALKRSQLGLSTAEMARRVGCVRTTIERNEKGVSSIRRFSVTRYAQAYQVGSDELAELCGYSNEPIIDSETTVSINDLEFLIEVARGLQKPMNITTVQQLLKCRRIE